MALSTKDVTFSVIALLLCILITAETIIVVLVRFDLTDVGPYSGLQRAAYATVSTLIASGITAFITSRIRTLWIADVDQHFFQALRENRMGWIQGKWGTTLGVGSVAEMFRFWEIQLSYLAAAIITTSIVASLTPTLDTKDLVYLADVSTGLPWRCAVVSDTQDSDYSVYEWQLSNGSYLTAGGNWAACPSRWAVTLMGGINFFNTSQYAYSDLGVAIKSTAIGSPVSIFGLDPVTQIGMTFVDLSGTYGSNLISTTQCVRVMTSNPISCHQGGTVNYTAGQQGPITVTSDDGACSTASIGEVDNPAVDNIMAKRICATGQPGQATIVLGGTSDFARWLAVAIDYPDRPTDDQDVKKGYTFAITCTLDARNSFGYRDVTLTLQDAKQIQETNLGRQLTGGDTECEPFNLDENLGLLGAAVSANWQPLSQNDGLDGWFDSINQMTIDFSGRQARLPPYSFENSVNALEDTLGLVVGLATARINGTMESVEAMTTVVNTRVGSGRLVGLVYLLPPLFSGGTLFWLLARTWGSGEWRFSSIKLVELEGVGYGEAVAERN